MARWPAALALLMLTACTRTGTRSGPANPDLIDRLLVRDWEPLCLQPSTVSCVQYQKRLSAAAFAECCRVKCESGSKESCTDLERHHPVRSPEFWNWPKVLDLPWKERLGVMAPPEVVEYLSLRKKLLGQPPRIPLAAVPEDDGFTRDLLAAWKELPLQEREDGKRLLIGVMAIKELGSAVEAVKVLRKDDAVGGVLAFDWGTTLQPVNEWAKRPLESGSRNHRRTTLVWLLRIGIARLAGKTEPKP